jgi:tetratricopeptide (TPR) repeat protein
VLRTTLFASAVAAGLLSDVVVATGQETPELPIRTEALAHPLAECPAWDPGAIERPTPEALDEARALAAAATEAALLGDLAGQRNLLQAASELDPFSQDYAYDRARAHEALAETEEAIRGYCRALALSSDGGDTAELGARLERLQAPLGPAIGAEARERYDLAVALMTQGSLEGAIQEFSAALTSNSELADAYYNRGLAHGALRQPEPAIEDLRSYLTRRPEARDRTDVEAAIRFLEEPPVNYGAGTAFFLGLTIPGAGHFYTGRGLGGSVLMALAGGAAAAGVFYERVEVLCLSVPRDGNCPQADVLSSESSRPLLVPALAAVGATALVSAISAYRGARARNDAAGRLGIAEAERIARGGGFRLLSPAITAGRDGLALEILRFRF